METVGCSIVLKDKQKKNINCCMDRQEFTIFTQESKQDNILAYAVGEAVTLEVDDDFNLYYDGEELGGIWKSRYLDLDEDPPMPLGLLAYYFSEWSVMFGEKRFYPLYLDDGALKLPKLDIEVCDSNVFEGLYTEDELDMKKTYVDEKFENVVVRNHQAWYSVLSGVYQLLAGGVAGYLIYSIFSLDTVADVFVSLLLSFMSIILVIGVFAVISYVFTSIIERLDKEHLFYEMVEMPI